MHVQCADSATRPYVFIKSRRMMSRKSESRLRSCTSSTITCVMSPSLLSPTSRRSNTPVIMLCQRQPQQCFVSKHLLPHRTNQQQQQQLTTAADTHLSCRTLAVWQR